MRPLSYNPLNAYIHRISEIPELDPAEELRLVQDLRTQRRARAMELLILSHLRLVVDIAFEYLKFEQSAEDLVQEGNRALVQAVATLEPRKGERLSSILGYRIKAEIAGAVLRNGSVVERGITKEQGKLFARTCQYRQGPARLSEARIKAIAGKVAARPAELARLEERRGFPDEVLGPGPQALRHHQLLEFHEDEVDDIERFEEMEWTLYQKSGLQQALAALDLRSMDILRRRWLQASRKVPLRSLASEYRISGERVRQIQKEAFEVLREQLG
jgi:RNA polymerase sigma-32 factor